MVHFHVDDHNDMLIVVFLARQVTTPESWKRYEALVVAQKDAFEIAKEAATRSTSWSKRIE